jgi:hypothetical protein
MDTDQSIVKNNYTLNVINSRPYFTRMIYDSYRKLNNNLSIEHEECVLNNDFYITIDEYFKGQNYEEMERQVQDINKNLTPLNDNIQIKENLKDLDITNANFLKPEEIPKRDFNKQISKIDSSNGYNFKSKNKKIISFIQSANINQNKIQDYVNQVYNNFDNSNYTKVIDKHNKILLLEKMMTSTSAENYKIKNAIDINSLKHKAEFLVSSRLRFIEKITSIISKFIIALKKLYNVRKEKTKNKENKELNHTYSLTSFNRENNNPIDTENIEQDDEKLKKIKEIISINTIKMINKTPESKKNKKKNISSIKKLLQQKKEEKDLATNKNFLSSIKNKMKFYDKQDEIFISEKVKKSTNRISSERYNNSNNKEDNFNYNNTKSQNIEKKQDDEKYICPKKKLNYSSLKLYISKEILKK